MRENMIYDTDQYQLRDYVLERMIEIIKNQHKVKTVFFGDSITNLMDVYHYFGEDCANCGIAGITSDLLLHFVDEGVLKYEPEIVYIMVGTNDLGNTTMTSPRQIALNVKEIVEMIHNNLPRCKIHLISCIPCIEKLHGYMYQGKGIRSNDTLRMVMEEYKRMIVYDYVDFIDVFDCLYDSHIESYFVDGLHLTKAGYDKYVEGIVSKG